MALFAFTAAIWLLPLLLMRMPGFIRWSGSFWGSMLEYAYTAERINADIVIFGDSSAIFAIDPLQIDSSLGLKAINLPNTISSLPIVEDLGLQHYLSYNSRPRLIVFYFAAWNLNYQDVARPDKLYEGEEMLVRHGTVRQIAAFAGTHPEEAALFPLRFYSANTESFSLSSLMHWDRVPGIAPARGHATRAVPDLKHLHAPCELPAELLRDTQADSAKALGDKYRAQGIPVMFYMAPVPACDNDGILAALPYAKVGAAPPKQIDPADYENDGYYAHLDGHAVPEATANLVAAIRSVLGSGPGASLAVDH